MRATRDPELRRRGRATGRMSRRIAVVLTMALALMAAAPPGQGPVVDDTPSLSQLLSWLFPAPAWAAPKPPTPVQDSGKAAGKDHYVPAGTTKSARGTAGHAPGRGLGELAADKP